MLLSKTSQLGFDPKLSGLHSLRAGRATAAANAGVPDRLFKRHGRWKSESAKDGYIKDSGLTSGNALVCPAHNKCNTTRWHVNMTSVVPTRMGPCLHECIYKC